MGGTVVMCVWGGGGGKTVVVCDVVKLGWCVKEGGNTLVVCGGWF